MQRAKDKLEKSDADGWLWRSLRRHGCFQPHATPGLRGLSPSHHLRGRSAPLVLCRRMPIEFSEDVRECDLEPWQHIVAAEHLVFVENLVVVDAGIGQI